MWYGAPTFGQFVRQRVDPIGGHYSSLSYGVVNQIFSRGVFLFSFGFGFEFFNTRRVRLTRKQRLQLGKFPPYPIYAFNT